MESLEKNTCRGCLSVDRRMLPIVEFSKKLCFSQLSSDNILDSLEVDSQNVMLCFECEATVNRFVKFKERVREAQWILENGLHQQATKSLSNLKYRRQFTISSSANNCNYTKLEFTYEVIKQELGSEIDIKQEFDTVNDIDGHNDEMRNCNDPTVNEEMLNNDSTNESDDDKFLIDLSNDKRIGNEKIKAKRCDSNSTEKKRDLKINKEKRYSKHKKDRLKRIKKKKIQCIYRIIQLSEEEIEEERRLLKLDDNYANSIFQCELCILSFPNADDLKDHISSKHEVQSKYTCKICTSGFQSEMSYNYHTNKHTKRFECTVCRERFTNKRTVMRHYQFTHQGNDFNLLTKLLKNGDIESHTTVTDGTTSMPQFSCEFCPKSFKWRTSLRKHTQAHRIETGQMRKPYCETCKLTFATTANLQKHLKTSTKHQVQLKLRKLGAMPLEKQEAQLEALKSSEALRKQLHGCAQCGKQFQWRGNLLRHLHSHTARAKGELVCHPCGRSFSSLATFKQHMQGSRRHISEDAFKYMCSECGKKFANKTRLKDHVDWEHLKNFVHKCPECQKVFKSHTSLYLHKQLHRKDVAQHLCDHCGKAFPNRTKLRAHITAMHTTESPYKCAECGAKFSWHSCLSRHLKRVHSVLSSKKSSVGRG